MVTNTLLTIDMITEESLIVLKNNFVLGRKCLRQFDGSFGQMGAKIGDTLRIRIPVRVTSVTGPAASPQNTDETQIPLALQTQRHTDFQYTTKDLALSLGEFSDVVLKPAMAQLASDIDEDGMNIITQGNTITGTYAGTYSGVNQLSTSVLTAGAPAAFTGANLTGILPFLNAKAIIKKNGPGPADDNYHVIVDPLDAAGIVDSLKSLFQDSTQISDQYLRGEMGTSAGFKWAESQNVPTLTTGTRAATGATLSANVLTGATTIAVTGMTPGSTVSVGETLWVGAGGVVTYAVNSLNRNPTGVVAEFIVTALVTASGGGTATIPVALGAQGGIIGPENAQYQTVNALPLSGAAVTFVGAASVTTRANLAYHRDAVALGVADLQDVAGKGAECYFATDPDAGLSVRYVSQYSAQTDLLTNRVDILYGWQFVRPVLATRVQG